MNIAGKVNECDLTGTKYDEPVDGAWMLCRGATGRVCCVLFAGPEEVERQNMTINTREEAEAWAESVPGGYADF